MNYCSCIKKIKYDKKTKENLSSLDSNIVTYYKNFETNKHTTFLVNDVIWNPAAYITPKGFVNSLKAMVKNTNYEATNTSNRKVDGIVNELSSVLSFKSSLPMKKEGINFTNILF
mgnify:CR=1 FL=1